MTFAAGNAKVRIQAGVIKSTNGESYRNRKAGSSLQATDRGFDCEILQGEQKDFSVPKLPSSVLVARQKRPGMFVPEVREHNLAASGTKAFRSAYLRRRGLSRIQEAFSERRSKDHDQS